VQSDEDLSGGGRRLAINTAALLARIQVENMVSGEEGAVARGAGKFCIVLAFLLAQNSLFFVFVCLSLSVSFFFLPFSLR
jgi:hypothetical protein